MHEPSTSATEPVTTAAAEEPSQSSQPSAPSAAGKGVSVATSCHELTAVINNSTTTPALVQGHQATCTSTTNTSKLAQGQHQQQQQQVALRADVECGTKILLDDHQSSMTPLSLPMQRATTPTDNQVQKETMSTHSSYSKDSTVCRICYQSQRSDTALEPMIQPCNCRGTLGLVHKDCLENWLNVSQKSTCELCHYHYRVHKTMKYTIWQSFPHWLRRGANHPRLLFDIVSLMIWTPLILAGMIMTVQIVNWSEATKAKHLLHKSAVFAGIMLALLVTAVLLGYCLWFVSIFKYHILEWMEWRRSQIVLRLMSKDEQIETTE